MTGVVRTVLADGVMEASVAFGIARITLGRVANESAMTPQAAL